MKQLRICSLMLALGTFSICSIPAHAQQDVDPDHFDQPSTFSRHVRGANPQSHHTATTAQRRANRKRTSAHSHQSSAEKMELNTPHHGEETAPAQNDRAAARMRKGARHSYHGFRNVGQSAGRMMFTTNGGGLDEYFAGNFFASIAGRHGTSSGDQHI